MLAWPQPIRQDPLRLGHPRSGHMPAYTAPSRTVSRRIACGSQWRPSHGKGCWRPGRNQFGDPVWLGLYKGVKCIFISKNPIFFLKNPSKSVLTLKNCETFSRNFLKS
jgi:hypothetical protein